MPGLADVRDRITGSSPGDWIPFSDRGTWTFRSDVDVRIQREERLDANLQTPWTQPLQAASQSHSFLVYYGSSPVEYHVIASVDNFRAHIPMPRQPTGPDEPFTISPYEATIGRIVTGDEQTFQAYLSTTGIEIAE